MSETQGSHRRVSWPGTEPDADPMPAPDLALDPELDLPLDPELDFAPDRDPDPELDLASALGLVADGGPDGGVPAPRGEGRRGSRRRGAPTAATPGTGLRPTGRRRAADPVPPPPLPDPQAQAPSVGRAAGRRRAGDPVPPPPLPGPDAGAPAAGRRRAADPGPEPDVPETRRPTGRRRAADPVPPPPLPGPDAPDSGRRRASVPAQGGGGRGGSGQRAAARGRRGAAARAGWRSIVPQALVVAVLAGGTTAFVAADKSVRLTVDGVPRSLHTFAGSVDALLAAEGLGVGPHDLVAPARGSDLADGEEIVVRYGRPLELTLDGRTRRLWTTARTVESALRQLGVRVEGAFLTLPRTAGVPRAGLTLGVRTERGVTFMADGRERTIRTNAATVQEALDQAGITLGGQDTTSVPPGAFPRDGQVVTVLRITGTREVREERIPFTTERVEDGDLFAGTEVVERAGRPGARRVTYSLRTVNGVRQQPRRIAEEVVREPVGQLVKVGTKRLPNSVAGADGLDWGALAQCESGGRASATDPSGTYGGLYQFDVRTWQGLGGSGRPQDASGSEQTYRAKKLYVQRGASPWPHCGRRLYR